jgi:RNase P/RNase MRP subunit POP5
MKPLVIATNTGVVECSKHYRHIIMNPLVIATNTGVVECSKHYRHIIMNPLVITSPVFVAMTKEFIIICL